MSKMNAVIGIGIILLVRGTCKAKGKIHRIRRNRDNGWSAWHHCRKFPVKTVDQYIIQSESQLGAPGGITLYYHFTCISINGNDLVGPEVNGFLHIVKILLDGLAPELVPGSTA